MVSIVGMKGDHQKATRKKKTPRNDFDLNPCPEAVCSVCVY